MSITKVCIKCNVEQDIGEFPLRSKNGTARRNECRQCRKIYMDIYNNLPQVKKARQEGYKTPEAKQKAQEYRQRPENKARRKQYNASYKKSEGGKQATKKYEQSDKRKLARSRWVKSANRKNWRRKHDKIRKKNDPIFKFRNNISIQIIAALKRHSATKNHDSCIKWLNAIEDNYLIKLIEHIENLFEPWMNWSNHGKYNAKTWDDSEPSTWTWNLDHIIPQSDLPYTSMEDENFKKCWAIENLRPLSSKQNLLDGVNRTRHTK